VDDNSVILHHSIFSQGANSVSTPARCAGCDYKS
jgi:hypothetical protein